MKPGDIVKSLSKDDEALLGEVLRVEKRNLHIQEIKKNSRNEKEIVAEIVAIINKAVGDDN